MKARNLAHHFGRGLFLIAALILAQHLAVATANAQSAPQCPCSIFSSATDPGLEATIDFNSPGVNVGIKFTSDTAGVITGLRFYKHVHNTDATGTHSGYLWDSVGNLAGRATFTNETATGWQQPVLHPVDTQGNAITSVTGVSIGANTAYTASYWVPTNPTTGYNAWPHNLNYFYTWGVDSPPLHVQGGGGGNSNTAVNGVFAYGSPGVFPTSVNQGHPTNYMVDVVFDATATPDPNSIPAVSSTSPANGGSGLDPNTTNVTVTFSKDINASTINSSTVQLRNGGSTVSSTLTYSSVAGDRTATLVPTASLSINTTYTIFVQGGSSGVKDLAGNALVANYSGTFTTSATAPNYGCSTQACSFWATFDPVAAGIAREGVDDVSGSGGINLGPRFQSDIDGSITGIRFYKTSRNTGTHLAYLWRVNSNGTGTQLATKTFANETATGWQQVQFDTPVSITRGTTYIAVYYMPIGFWTETRPSILHTGPILQAPLRMLQNFYGQPNNVYAEGTAGLFPTTDPFDAPNYWLDVNFTTSGSGGGVPAGTAPLFSSSNSTTFTVGTPGSFTIVTAGDPTPSITESGSVPAGVTFTPNSDGTATLSGTPAVGSGNVYALTFTATNTAGTATQTFTLTVNEAPAITTQPANQTICAGTAASFIAAATGFPTPTLQWQVSTDGGTTWSDISGATSSPYTFTTTAADNTKRYRAVFTNAGGSAPTSAASLTVDSPLSVNTNPSSQAVCANSAVTFVASSNGNGSIQWQVSPDGVTFTPISGATSGTYTFTAAATDNNKRYRAVFTNSCGSATTSAATLTVNAAPSVTTQPVSQTACAGT